MVAPVFAEPLPGLGGRHRDVPEFLREGSGVDDFFAPPFFVVGTGDDAGARTVAELFALPRPRVHHVDVGTAEALKYACNAFHATKVSFANEMGRVFRVFGVDSREVMRIFCEDSKLNISPTYLRPGFAYGGSLPAQGPARAPAHGADERRRRSAARRDRADATSSWCVTSSTGSSPRRTATSCLLGLSFKMDTDDLRESPNVELAERLIGKGFNVRIYDPIVNPERLVGRQQAPRRGPTSAPQPPAANTPEEALAGAEVGRRRVDRPRASLDALRDATPVARLRCHRPARDRSRPSTGSAATAGESRRRGDPARPRVLIIVQNLPVPFDRRVWLECQNPARRGLRRHRGLPARQGRPAAYQVVEGVTIHGYRPYAPGGSAGGYVAGVRALVPRDRRGWPCKARRRGRFDVIQACNPPDIFWPLARWFRRA